MLIDLILILSYITLAVAVIATAWAVWHTISRTTRQGGYVHGLPTRRIAIGLCCGLVVLLLMTFVLGGSDAIRINGEQYTDVLVLKCSDMLINTSLALIVIAGVCALFSFYREARRMDKESNILLELLRPKRISVRTLSKTRIHKRIKNEVKQ